MPSIDFEWRVIEPLQPNKPRGVPRVDDPLDRDPRLIQLIACGRAAYAELWKGVGQNDAIRRSHLTRLARLHFLAPDIIMSILDGRQPVERTTRSLMRVAQLPLCWIEQRRVLGYC